MTKVLIAVCVPATGDNFDIFAPVDVPICELSSIVANGIGELTNGRYAVSGMEQLCLQAPAGLLDASLTLQDYGVKNGMQLYLI